MPQSSRSNPSPPDRHPEPAASEPKRQRRIQSIEVGMRVLQALTEQRRPLPLKELAQLADMPPGKAHPYLVSFMAAGMAKQSPLTGHYERRAGAVDLGAVLREIDDARAEEAARRLRLQASA